MKEKIEFLKKHPFLVFSVIFIFIPLIIYLLSVVQWMPSGDNDWAGFWGGYIGAIIGGICTVIGVYWTIDYSQENYKEDVRNRTLPYISLYALQQDRLTDLLISTSRCIKDTEDLNPINESNKYREYRLEKIFMVIENKEISYKKELTERQEKLIENGGMEEVYKEGITSLYSRKIVSVPIELENVGNGIALQFNVGLNRLEDKEPKFLFPFDLKVGEKMCIHIFSEYTSNIIGDYVLEVHYEDLLNNSYHQKFEFKVEKDESRNRIFTSLELCGKQVRE